ncbi:MAG TPA: hypothetical protein VIO94_10690 [Phenylobacterium sp.]
MRALLTAAALLAANAAAAQDLYDPTWMARDAELRSQQELMRQRDVALQNQLTTLELRLQTEQSLRMLQEQRLRPYLPAPPERRTAQPSSSGTTAAGFAEIPDSRLSQSNSRVREASGGR